MYKDKDALRSFVFFSGSGCLLPSLIIFNLLFGWIFLKPKPWLIIEAILLLLFIINGYNIRRKIISTSSKRDDIIDVKGEVVEDRHHLK
jgi:uncharacterized membrane protein